ncbi:spherulation-specific family 4 protein [Aspergillus affinis]|uniref:spherulation-specific family 4 protein n=1 Tax=Aspergillus affinis TaxID=1070780 RepID=UPI0022FE5AED|nr:putative spherulin 4-like cell surface protein [Aspergillus affinis]KAI9041836.1 putative spherulin 4-like cell surface protein [Aspergillus affinis]
MFLDKHARLLAGVLGLMALAPQTSAAPWGHWHDRHHGPGDRGDSTPSVTPTPSSQPTGVFSIQPVQPTDVSSVIPTLGASSTPAATPSASFATISSSSAKGEVMIPYYLYPEAGKWEPLENLSVLPILSSPCYLDANRDRVTSNPDVKFTVIVNPDNGPGGSTTLQDQNFLTNIPKLAAHSNVRLIGYVATGWGDRDISEVQADIKQYAEWPSSSGDSSFAVKGIFLDEGATAYSEATVSFYEQAASLIKESSGLGPDNYVVANPGTPPDAAYLKMVDSSVIFESPYAEFENALSSSTFSSLQDTTGIDRASMVYNVPESVDLSSVLEKVKGISNQVYISNVNNYATYDPAWETVAQLLTSN